MRTIRRDGKPSFTAYVKKRQRPRLRKAQKYAKITSKISTTNIKGGSAISIFLLHVWQLRNILKPLNVPPKCRNHTLMGSWRISIHVVADHTRIQKPIPRPQWWGETNATLPCEASTPVAPPERQPNGGVVQSTAARRGRRAMGYGTADGNHGR